MIIRNEGITSFLQQYIVQRALRQYDGRTGATLRRRPASSGDNPAMRRLIAS